MTFWNLDNLCIRLLSSVSANHLKYTTNIKIYQTQYNIKYTNNSNTTISLRYFISKKLMVKLEFSSSIINWLDSAEKMHKLFSFAVSQNEVVVLQDRDRVQISIQIYALIDDFNHLTVTCFTCGLWR